MVFIFRRENFLRIVFLVLDNKADRNNQDTLNEYLFFHNDLNIAFKAPGSKFHPELIPTV